MRSIQAQVIAFHRACDHPIREVPTADIPVERVRLRLLLALEEVLEFGEALYGVGCPEFRMCFDIVSNLTKQRTPRVDLGKVADALGDIDYVVEGARLEFGIDGDSIADAIHETNMKKVGGPKSPEGKTMKPLDWMAPDFKEILRKQTEGEIANVGVRLRLLDTTNAPKFRALEWVRIRSRGFAAMVECDKERDRENSGLRGPVYIDGELYECTAVERHLPAFPIQPGERIGLLVR
jgi:predicted HAD superfamily Cof-like phosphohydrolase